MAIRYAFRRAALWLSLAGSVLVFAGHSLPARGGQKDEMEFAVSIARKGLWQEAVHRFRELVDRSPGNPRAWNNLAVALEATGRYEDAKQAYEKAASLAGNRYKEIGLNRESFDAYYQNRAARRGGQAKDASPDKGSPGGKPNG